MQFKKILELEQVYFQLVDAFSFQISSSLDVVVTEKVQQK